MSWPNGERARRPTALFPLLAGLLLLLPAAPARGYVALSTDGWDRFRWATGLPVAWTYAPAGSDDVALGDVVSSLDAAFRSWAGVSCASLDFALAGSAEVSGDGRIHVVFVEADWDLATDDAAAVAETFRDSSGRIVRAVIRFNGADLRWSTTGGDPTDARVADVQGVATHEIGHAVGLAHSRERHATMFFAGGEQGNRTLGADDERGLCYLYPAVPFTDGHPCDTCDDDSGCTGGGCLYFPAEGGFCGGSCAGDTDCPTGFACATDNEAIGSPCLPMNGHCDERGGNIGLGGYCYGDATCASGRCLVTPESAFCTQSCDPERPDATCPHGARCVRAGADYLCVSPGPLPFGATCDSHADCASAYCVLSLAGGVCTQPCGTGLPPCPDDAPCATDACIPPGPRPLGAPCLSHFDCATALCLVTPRRAYCSSECAAPEPPCPDGAVCLDFGTQDYCRAVGNQPEGGYCAAPERCDPGLTCQQGDTTGDWSWCVRACDPVDDTGCDTGEVCRWAPGLPDANAAGSPPGRCETAGGRATGESCGPAAGACQADLGCVLADDGSGRCARDCSVSDGRPCATDERCHPLSATDRPGRGLCVAETDSVVTVWEPGEALPESPATVVPELVSALVPISEASPPSSGGCSPSGLRAAAPRRVKPVDMLLFIALLCLLRWPLARRTAQRAWP